MNLRPAVLALALLAASPKLSGADLVVYDDGLQNGHVDWSWATHSLSQTSVVRTGAAAASFEPDSWQALYFHRDSGIDVAQYEAVDFWVRGGGGGGQAVRVALLIAGNVAGSATVASLLPGGIPAGSWGLVHVPFATLGVTAGILDGVWLQDDTGGNQSVVYVDDMRWIERTGLPPPPTSVTISVNPSANRRAIDPRIYGVNFGTTAQANAMHWPVRRWGGNSTTRYSWEHDIANTASDWFFYNVERDNPDPSDLPNNSSADRFVDDTKASGGETLLTIPTIGWTPIDRQRRWGFSVHDYGAQTETECTRTGGAPWCQPDAGNGIAANGTPIVGNDPLDTSRVIGPAFVTAWMQHLAARVGNAANGGVRLYALDNEVMLWNSTHRDVHPAPVTYDELWTRTVAYATAIKQQDPAAQVMGPVTWGWCDLFTSAADVTPQNCVSGPDRTAHEGLPLVEWYLKKVTEHQQQTGLKLVDWLDLHYYPQANGVALSDDESAATAALRLRSIKSLYDPSYQDESWIPNAVRLIPRAREWIAARAPGTKLAITEYSWGNDAGPSSALAQAEVLAVFGREGVDLATRWVSPDANTRVEDAFKLFLNYDGAGAKVLGESVLATTSDVDAVGSYAVRGTTKLFLLLFNKATSVKEANVSITGGPTAAGNLYRFDPSNRIGAAGSAPFVAGAATLTLPARSATLVVLPFSGGSPAPTVSNVAPSCASTVGGRTITISGSGFQAGATVTLAGTAATVTNVTPTAITATVGARPAAVAT
ncbi:MAG: IPT/TIG domain-containing protein, partial [Acidobacteria bacterium]|nr:IPT/TIG domain-containing protein [Acidobacteriota bacterium]